MSQKLRDQGIPLIGAATGAIVDAAFADHFGRVARYHLGNRELERRYGEQVVRAPYLAQTRRLGSIRRRGFGSGLELVGPV